MKLLVRMSYNNLTMEHKYDKLIEEDRKKTDDFLSKYFEIHNLSLSVEEAKECSISPYCRDNFVQLNNNLILSSGMALSNDGTALKYDFQEKFGNIVSKIGYNMENKENINLMIVEDGYAHEAMYFKTKDFLITSSILGFDEIRDSLNLSYSKHYKLHQLSTKFNMGLVNSKGDTNINANGHLDTRFAILEDMKIIFYSPDTYSKVNKLYEENYIILNKIRDEFGYELREYQFEKNKIKNKYFSKKYDKLPFPRGRLDGPSKNGINFLIKDDKIFTSSITKEDKSYLAKKGIEAIIVPMNYSYNGAGLKCIYGELKDLI